MRVPVLIAGLGAAVIFAIALTAQPANAGSAKKTCPCNCPDDHKVRQRHAENRPLPHRLMRHYAQGARYSYRGAAPFHPREWHGPWRMVPNDAYLPATRRNLEPAGLVIDQGGWSGGVGYGEEGGSGGGYGQVLLANGNSQNGPTYNSFGQSFQQNPSMPHPFQNRLMGGLAPRK
ncbi:MAG TPA: hypothetical protein VMO78_09600 [Rhizomicrobium sp.]|nr:hypothetical protein [Rhizomicrobium sp.]